MSIGFLIGNKTKSKRNKGENNSFIIIGLRNTTKLKNGRKIGKKMGARNWKKEGGKGKRGNVIFEMKNWGEKLGGCQAGLTIY